MRVLEPVEVFYLVMMKRWEGSAPPDRHQGLLDGEPTRNTQTQRLKYVLDKIAIGVPGHADRIYSTLAQYTRRQDGESYISKNPTWMQEPEKLSEDWYFEGCTSLPQKENVIAALSHAGLSAAFLNATRDFVAHRSIEKYFPIAEDEAEINRRIQKWEARNAG